MHGHVRRTAVQCVSVLTAAGFLLAPAGMPSGTPMDPRAVDVVRTWVDSNHPKARCGGQDRLELMRQLMDIDPFLTEDRAYRLLSDTIGKLRPTTQVSTRGAAGMKGAHTTEEVKKKKEVDRARKPAAPPGPRNFFPPAPPAAHDGIRAPRLPAGFLQYFKELRREPELLRTRELIDEMTSDILNQLHAELGGLSIRDIALNPKCSLYFGFTSVKAVAEAYMFMGRTRCAVRRWRAKPGTTRMHYTPLDCREELGMKYLVVYDTDIKSNAFEVESALQQALHHLPLGRRLWRIVGMGQPNPNTFPDDARHKVFVTYSFKVQAGIENKTIIVQE